MFDPSFFIGKTAAELCDNSAFVAALTSMTGTEAQERFKAMAGAMTEVNYQMARAFTPTYQLPVLDALFGRSKNVDPA